MGLYVLYLGVGKAAPGQGWECAAWCRRTSSCVPQWVRGRTEEVMPLQLYLEQLAKGPVGG